MKVLCGTDIIEIDRIKESMEQLGEHFLDRIFTEKEKSYCESKKNQKYQHYAARFAAKEATFKAVSELLEDKYNISWKNIEIVNDDTMKPRIQWVGIDFPEITSLDISISHCKQYAVSNVVIVTN